MVRGSPTDKVRLQTHSKAGSYLVSAERVKMQTWKMWVILLSGKQKQVSCHKHRATPSFGPFHYHLCSQVLLQVSRDMFMTLTPG